jgi:hypothetical protein
MVGAFGLTTLKDFLGKLSRELEKFRAAPNDADAAINFFVTAEHMLDWLYPGLKNRSKRERLRNNELMLQVVSHLASSSKHYDQLSPHHQSVLDSGQLAGFVGAMQSNQRGGSRLLSGSALTVWFSAAAAVSFGATLPAVELAKRVYRYWEAHV